MIKVLINISVCKTLINHLIEKASGGNFKNSDSPKAVIAIIKSGAIKKK